MRALVLVTLLATAASAQPQAGVSQSADGLVPWVTFPEIVVPLSKRLPPRPGGSPLRLATRWLTL